MNEKENQCNENFLIKKLVKQKWRKVKKSEEDKKRKLIRKEKEENEFVKIF